MIRILLLVGGAILLGLLLRHFSEKGSDLTLDIRAVPQSDDGVKDLIRQRKKIAAIKLYREIHRVGLKEAKEAVEQIERQM